MRIIGRRLCQMIVAAGTDKVMAGFPLPAGGTLNQVYLTAHIIGPEQTPYQNAVHYGVTGFVLPVRDPDNSETYDVMWDTQVPKDLALTQGGFDLDVGAADATPEFELGLPDYGGIFNVTSLAPKEIFRRRKMITVASGGPYEAVSSASDVYTPIDRIQTKVKQKVAVNTPSMVLFGFSSPDTLETTAVVLDIPEESEWALLQYMEVTLENAYMYLLGLVEAGAETPYVESSTFIAELLEHMYEENAGYFKPVSWVVYCQATFDISVPGRINFGTLTSEG